MNNYKIIFLLLYILISVSTFAQKRGTQKIWTSNTPQCEGIWIHIEVDKLWRTCVKAAFKKRTNLDADYSIMQETWIAGNAWKGEVLFQDYFPKYHEGRQITEISYIVYVYVLDTLCIYIEDTLSVDTVTFYRTCFKDTRTTPQTLLTPNGDGSNDIFRLPLNYTEFHTIYIFNALGQPVYAARNTSGDEWNGGWDGGVQPPGVYFWTAVFDDPLKKKLSGKIVLVR